MNRNEAPKHHSFYVISYPCMYGPIDHSTYLSHDRLEKILVLAADLPFPIVVESQSQNQSVHERERAQVGLSYGR